jgi:hypothetical protein
MPRSRTAHGQSNDSVRSRCWTERDGCCAGVADAQARTDLDRPRSAPVRNRSLAYPRHRATASASQGV